MIISRKIMSFQALWKPYIQKKWYTYLHKGLLIIAAISANPKVSLPSISLLLEQ